jgi:predicted dinucleotide-binding enzyme
MKVGVIGSGQVGEVLATGFHGIGHEVMRGSRNPDKLAAWVSERGERASAGDFAQTASFGEMVVLAVKGEAAEAVVRLAGPENLAGKPVLDATNPIDEAPPKNGVLRFFTSYSESLMERLQELAPAAHFVKAFSCVGSALMVNPQLKGGPPTMFICGNDAGAKTQAREILDAFGWETEDLGMAEAARAIEPLCILWCIPGFRDGDWVHALKMLR